jgi:hypothetical protein
VLFSGPFDTTQDNNYDVSADGHFIMVEAAPEATLHALQVVLNWSADLKRLVSAKNLVNRLYDVSPLLDRHSTANTRRQIAPDAAIDR